MYQFNPTRGTAAILVWLVLLASTSLNFFNVSISGPPIAVEGPTFLLTYDGSPAQFSPENRKYQDVLLDSDVLKKLDEVAVVESKDDKGKEQHAYRIWEHDRDPKNQSKLWQELQARPKKQKYWVYASNKKRWTEGPLPDNEADMLKLIDQYKE